LLDLRSRDLRVIPICPYVRSWIGRHPAYADLVIDDPAPPE
jgi:predicted GNAT family acetyltransferase